MAATLSVASGERLRALQKAIAYDFDDGDLLVKALTHRSASQQNNERLEFLGDSILNHVIADALFQKFPEAKEGQLSRLRTVLVRGDYLAKIADSLALSDCLVLGAGERKSGGRNRASILADAVEAILGAIFVERGYEASRNVILHLFAKGLDEIELTEEKDPKTRLQEWLQGRGLGLPDYELAETTGVAHNQQFTVICRVPDLKIHCSGRGSSRRKAEQAAAKTALEGLQNAR